MATVRLDDPSRDREFTDLFYEYQKAQPTESNTVLTTHFYPTRLDHTPGQLSYSKIPLEFLPVLLEKGYPFTVDAADIARELSDEDSEQLKLLHRGLQTNERLPHKREPVARLIGYGLARPEGMSVRITALGYEVLEHL